MKNHNEPDFLLQVTGLKKYYPVRSGFWRRGRGEIKAVDDLNLELRPGEILGLVGESGCGKTTAIRTLLRLYPATAGRVLFRTSCLSPDRREQTVDLAGLNETALKTVRREIAMVFQDPVGSLNPRRRVYDIITEPLRVHRLVTAETRRQTARLVERVGLQPEILERYPHEFSGGQRQRISLARALILEPRLVILDEPVSALDVSVQAQILNLLQELQAERNLAYLFVAHDLSVVEHISDRVAVMYLGRLVERGGAGAIYHQPLHPYTEGLMQAVPRVEEDKNKQRKLIGGEIPDPSQPPPGCAFHPRCLYSREICRQQIPVWRELGEGHGAACHRAEELRLNGV